MDSGFYVAYAGLASRMQVLDVVASNLANASTVDSEAMNVQIHGWNCGLVGRSVA